MNRDQKAPHLVTNPSNEPSRVNPSKSDLEADRKADTERTSTTTTQPAGAPRSEDSSTRK